MKCAPCGTFSTEDNFFNCCCIEEFEIGVPVVCGIQRARGQERGKGCGFGKRIETGGGGGVDAVIGLVAKAEYYKTISLKYSLSQLERRT
jgi:hypothetical protein